MNAHQHITKLLSTRETAEFYGIGRATLWRWLKDGLLPQPLRIGRRTYWEAAALEKHVSELRARQTD